MIHSCDASGLLPVSDAISKMILAISTTPKTEYVLLEQAYRRVLAHNLVSTIQVPPADNSAMDGYAMRSEDLIKDNQLEMIGTALAGAPFEGEIQAGQCVRIMTGATLPVGADSVVMQENTETKGNLVLFHQQPLKGNSVRKAGEDIQINQVVVSKGTSLTAAHLGVLASVGVHEVEVTTKIKVALIATGDELTSPGQPLKKGAIYESNRFALRALLENFSVETVDYGIVPDNKDDLRKVFIDASQTCDLILSCGGVSVGDADYVKPILAELGQINFWKVAIKPGKPFAFGRLKQAWFCGLPGNPVSSFVTFEQLVTPVLNKLCGQNNEDRDYFFATAATNIFKRSGRADYQRGIFYRNEQGTLLVTPNGKQGSGIMSSIANANCYIILSEESANVKQGEQVKIQPF